MNGSASVRPKPTDRPRTQGFGVHSASNITGDSQVNVLRSEACVRRGSEQPAHAWLYTLQHGRLNTDLVIFQDSISVLRMFTDGNRSYSLRHPAQMQRFLGAALTHCKSYPNDVAYLLRCLGSQDTAGLQRLREISCYPHAIAVYIVIQICLALV